MGGRGGAGGIRPRRHRLRVSRRRGRRTDVNVHRHSQSYRETGRRGSYACPHTGPDGCGETGLGRADSYSHVHSDAYCFGQRDSGSDPGPTATPTPTPASSDPEPSATTTPAVTTTEVVAAGPPLGDCFGGVLSEDPMHAGARGLIDILGVYDADGPRFVSVSQPRVTADMVRFALEQSYALYDAWPRLVYPVGYGCSETVEPWPDCYLKAVGGWYGGGYLLLPRIIAHEAPVMLVTGGEIGRRKTPSWASWRQLWPRTGAHEGTGTRANGGGPAFDVSDVDVTNFPEVDCGSSVSSNSCRWWKDFPEVGIAGAHGGVVSGTSRSRTLPWMKLSSRH